VGLEVNRKNLRGVENSEAEVRYSSKIAEIHTIPPDFSDLARLAPFAAKTCDTSIWALCGLQATDRAPRRAL